ncbi:mitochondrial glycoprotein [Lipomyces oligophaga]|uniref:mitochondrial glycoprotein n=1 Tax=Lipomyces oligophaga TaxID=45792 RepID=UPI0034CEE7B2
MASRIISRVVSLPVRSVRKPALNILSAGSRQALAFTSVRSFSITQLRGSQTETSKALATVLTGELEYETEKLESDEIDGIPDPAKNFLESSGFKIVSPPSEDSVSLEGQINGAQVVVRFVPSDIHENYNEDEYDEENIVDENGNVDPMYEQSGQPVVFTKIFITKPNAGTLAVETVVREGKFVVELVSHFDDSSVALSQSAEAENDRRLKYWGPPFNELDPRLVKLMPKYLAEFGIDDELAIFISEFAPFKENKLYIESLEKIRNFVSA